jgi:hypothetical protein
MSISEFTEIIFNLLFIPVNIGLMIFIARKFVKLANAYNMNKWVFGILGVISFFVGFWFGTELQNLLSEVEMMKKGSYSALAILFLMALLISFGFYHTLRHIWSRRKAA